MKDDFKTMLEAAKERQGSVDFVGYIAAYCDNRQCSAREFEVMVKCYRDDYESVSVRCPLCGQEPIPNGVLTLQEHENNADYDARIRVNIQRYVKREGRPCFIPGNLLFDDSLF